MSSGISRKLEVSTSIDSQATEFESIKSGETTPQSQTAMNGHSEDEELEKEIIIKNLDTGQAYKLGFEGGNKDNIGQETAQVTDLNTGQEYEYQEFEEKLGLAARLNFPKLMDDNLSVDGSQYSVPGSKKGGNKPGGSHTSSTSMAEIGFKAKVNTNRKLVSELTDVVLIQNIQAHKGYIWAIKFSMNNQYLATGGADCTVKLWNVIQSRDSELLLKNEPYRIWQGHSQQIMDLCWSKSQFLLSASMDKTVRLWHVKMDEQLRIFRHNDYVTSVNFHPKDDTMFISGSIDQKVRIWNIPDQKVMDWSSVHEMVTATQLSADGRKVVVGTFKGKCFIYTCERARLEYNAKIEVKNTGQFSKGHKVTGIEFLPSANNRILVTTNDSRIRMYDSFQEIQKFKGHTNLQTQIRSHFSRDGNFVISGSDDGDVYVWTTENLYLPDIQNNSQNKKEKLCSYENFQAHEGVVTVACFGPRLASKKDASSASIMEHGGGGGGGIGGGGGGGDVPPVSKAVQTLLKSKDSFLGGQRYSEEQQQMIEQQLQKRILAAHAYGMVIVTAGIDGELKIWENRGRPDWIQ